MNRDNLTILENQNLRLREENDLLRRAVNVTECGHSLIQQRDEFAKLIKLGKTIVAELDINKVFNLVAETARDLISAELLIVPIIDANRETYTYLATSGLGSADMLNVSFKTGVGMCGWVLRNERPLLFGETDEWWMDKKTRWEKGQQSALLVPLMGEKGGRQIIGGLSGIGKIGGGSFSVHDLDVLSLFANQVSAAIENARLFKEVEINSYALTLSNQRLEEEIQERLRAEATLRESEERYRTLLDQATDAIFVSDMSARFIDTNREACEGLGYTREELLTLSLSDVDPNFEADEHVKNFWEGLSAGKTVMVESYHRRKDGSLFPVEIHIGKLDINGQPAILGIARDISERCETATILAAERERLAVTLRSIGDGVITTDSEQNIVMLNKVAEALTGWSNQEAMGRPFHDVFRIINEQTRQPCENPVHKVLATGQIIGLANHTILIAKDGTERCIADSCAPICDKQSRIIGAVLVFRDVTEHHKTEKERLKIQKIESVGVLAGGIAHDFNNILAAILGNLSLSLIDESLSAATREFLQDAEKASLRARDLTQQLLTFSKGGFPIKEISSLVEVIKDSANFILRGKQTICQFSFPDDLWCVEIDKGQISQVIQNIVLNASQAITGSGTISITCCNTDMIEDLNCVGPRERKYVKISINDYGIGIPANVVDKIFDPYYSTKKEGSGLGLAISHAIITKHEGQIFVKSTSGVGTTFTLYIPATSGEARTSAQVAISPARNKIKILIMDDDKMIRDVAKAMLTKLGHEVVLAMDGDEAIKAFRDAENTIDLVIMDLTIPGGMGGKEAVREILRINPAAKVVVSSGYSNDPIMANFKDYGFCSALVKPYQFHELSNVISQECHI